MEMEGIVFIATGIAIFTVINVLIIVIVLKFRRKFVGNVDDHMKLLAETLGLPVTGGDSVFPNISFLSWIRRPLRIEGERRGCDVSIYHYSTGGKNSTTYATMRITLDNPKDLKMGFSRESMLGKLGKTFGMQDIQTGDQRFDDMFIVKCSDPEFIKRALLPEIKERFYEVWETHKSQGTITLRDDAFAYAEVGMIRSDAVRNRFAAVAELMCDLGGTVKFYNQ